MKQSKITLQRFPIPEPLLLLLFSCVLVTLFSTCSPLYPINPWDDANVFMTIGKSMLRGKVLYRDIFDQKGPVLFFLHELAAAISYTSFLGIYIFEVLGLWCFAWYSLKSIRLFSDSRLNMPLLCLLMLLTVTSDAFFYGDSAEEFCLPLLSHALYFMLRFVKERETQPSPVQGLLFGAGMGIVFWIKFNIVVFFYGGSLLALICIACHERRLRELARVVPWALLGMAAVTVAVLAYFICHHLYEPFQIHRHFVQWRAGRMVVHLCQACHHDGPAVAGSACKGAERCEASGAWRLWSTIALFHISHGTVLLFPVAFCLWTFVHSILPPYEAESTSIWLYACRGDRSCFPQLEHRHASERHLFPSDA